jgi:hypothetical protein
MKKLFLLLLAFFFQLSAIDHQLDMKALSELASYLGISQDADLIAETQKQWLRKPNQERWEMSELSSDQRAFVLNWAKEQGFYAPCKPQDNTSYDKAFVLGATTSAMKVRLSFLADLWKEGIRFHEIIWLTSDRPLDSRVDQYLDRCATESQAARCLWEEAALPEEMKTLSVTFIAAPMKPEGRPNRADTLAAWLKSDPQPSKLLFISNQPFCGYEFSTIKKHLPDTFDFELAGPGADPARHPAAAALILDTIARELYNTSH